MFGNVGYISAYADCCLSGFVVNVLLVNDPPLVFILQFDRFVYVAATSICLSATIASYFRGLRLCIVRIRGIVYNHVEHIFYGILYCACSSGIEFMLVPFLFRFLCKDVSIELQDDFRVSLIVIVVSPTIIGVLAKHLCC